MTATVLVPLFEGLPVGSVVVLDASRMHPRDEAGLWLMAAPEQAEQGTVWRWLFERLNERRNRLIARKLFLIVVGPRACEVLLASHAPDTWSVRSSVLHVAPFRRRWPLRRLPSSATLLKNLLQHFSYETSGLEPDEVNAAVDAAWRRGREHLKTSIEHWVPSEHDRWLRRQVRRLALAIVDNAEFGWAATATTFEGMVFDWYKHAENLESFYNDDRTVFWWLPMLAQLAAQGRAYRVAYAWASLSFRYHKQTFGSAMLRAETEAQSAVLAAASALALGAPADAWVMTWEAESALESTIYGSGFPWSDTMTDVILRSDDPSNVTLLTRARDLFEGVTRLYASLGDRDRATAFGSRVAQVSQAIAAVRQKAKGRDIVSRAHDVEGAEPLEQR